MEIHKLKLYFLVFCHRSDEEDSPPKGKIQKLVSMSLHDAEFCKQEQASFTPDMLDVAAEIARYLWEELDPRLRKVSWPVQYDCRSLYFLGFSGPEFVAVHGYAKSTLILLQRIKWDRHHILDTLARSVTRNHALIVLHAKHGRMVEMPSDHRVLHSPGSHLFTALKRWDLVFVSNFGWHKNFSY